MGREPTPAMERHPRRRGSPGAAVVPLLVNVDVDGDGPRIWSEELAAKGEDTIPAGATPTSADSPEHPDPKTAPSTMNGMLVVPRQDARDGTGACLARHRKSARGPSTRIRRSGCHRPKDADHRSRHHPLRAAATCRIPFEGTNPVLAHSVTPEPHGRVRHLKPRGDRRDRSALARKYCDATPDDQTMGRGPPTNPCRQLLVFVGRQNQTCPGRPPPGRGSRRHGRRERRIGWMEHGRLREGWPAPGRRASPTWSSAERPDEDARRSRVNVAASGAWFNSPACRLPRPAPGTARSPQRTRQARLR